RAALGRPGVLLRRASGGHGGRVRRPHLVQSVDLVRRRLDLPPLSLPPLLGRALLPRRPRLPPALEALEHDGVRRSLTAESCSRILKFRARSSGETAHTFA